MARHVAYIEAHGKPTPQRLDRQRAILNAVGRQYRPLPGHPPQDRHRPINGYAFSTKTSAPDAVARLVGILASIDKRWRDYVRVWDGWGRDDRAEPILSDPPQRGPLDIALRILRR